MPTGGGEVDGYSFFYHSRFIRSCRACSFESPSILDCTGSLRGEAIMMLDSASSTGTLGGG
jgi:hypothetical protein